MNSQFFVSCLESRMEEETSWYSRFEIGPFETGQALTVANSLRRTLLGYQKGVFLVAVEIEGAIHEYSRLEGIKEAILDILLNFRQISLILKDDSQSLSQQTLIGYFDIQGPGQVTARDLKFPKQIECVNPNQVIATLNRNASFQGRFLIAINATSNLKNNSIGDPVRFSREIINDELGTKMTNAQWLYVNPILNPIKRVNYVVQQIGDSLIQKELIHLELWTNGTVHPKKAIQTSALELATLFNSLSVFNELSLKLSSSFYRFKQAKREVNKEQQLSYLTKDNFSLGSKLNEKDSQEKLADRVATILDLDIANLNLSLQLYLILKKLNIANIGNLIQYKKQDLQNLTNFSSEKMNELEKALQLFGLSFS